MHIKPVAHSAIRTFESTSRSAVSDSKQFKTKRCPYERFREMAISRLPRHHNQKSRPFLTVRPSATLPAATISPFRRKY